MKCSQYIHNSGRLQFLDSIRAIAIIFVVCIHTTSYIFGLSLNVIVIVNTLMLSIAVPIFFFVDGYLFSAKSETYRFKKHILHDGQRLLIPWLAFTLIYTLLRWYFEAIGMLSNKIIVGRPVEEVLLNSYGSVYSNQLYFLLSLFFIRQLRPLMKLTIIQPKLWIALLNGVALSTISVSLLPTIQNMLYIKSGLEPITHALWGLSFYVFGVLIYRLLVNITISSLKVILIILSVLLILYFLVDSAFPYIIFQHLYLLTIFLAFYIYTFNTKFVTIIGKHTMGIYLLHTPIIMFITTKVMTSTISNTIISFSLSAAITLLLSLLSSVIILKLPFGHNLFGLKS